MKQLILYGNEREEFQYELNYFSLKDEDFFRQKTTDTIFKNRQKQFYQRYIQDGVYEDIPTKKEILSLTDSGIQLYITLEYQEEYDSVALVKTELKKVLKNFLDLQAFGKLTTMTKNIDLRVYLTASSNGGAGYLINHDKTRKPVMAIFLPMVAVMGNKKNLFCGEKWKENSSQWNYKVRAYIIHELGHVLHQLYNLEYFKAVDFLGRMSNGDSSQTLKIPVEASRVFKNKPSGDKARQSSATKLRINRIYGTEGLGVFKGNYASTHFNEFVAEYFTVQMMGHETHIKADLQYMGLGGPQAIKGCLSPKKVP